LHKERMVPIRPLTSKEGRLRKLVVVSVVVMVFLALGAGVALADDARIQCTSVPCYASGDDDLVLERKGNGKRDEIILRGGNDLVRANRYTDDKDVVEGGLGDDRIYVDDGDKLDTANAGQGRRDVCYVDARSEAGQGCGKVIVR
jgi:hypothetical protein